MVKTGCFGPDVIKAWIDFRVVQLQFHPFVAANALGGFHSPLNTSTLSIA
jgi:hypothetical protein|tara:strand:- start:7410 stop:7559 length:150 start_codon:yes stop_codon:yes gene_type:complete